MKVLRTLLPRFACVALLVSVSGNAVSEWGESKEWMGLINQDCSPTFRGKLKRMSSSERSFWAWVDVYMSSWKEDMSESRSYYESLCLARDDASRRLSCIASIQADIDWFARCKSQVVFLCRKAGGLCDY